MAFDETTAYRNDYQWVSRIVNVTWEFLDEAGQVQTTDGLKARFGPISSPDLLSVAAGLGLSSQAAAITVWEPKPSDVDVADWVTVFDPKPGHILRKEVIEEGAVAEGWLVKDASRSTGKGKWFLLAVAEVTNA